MGKIFSSTVLVGTCVFGSTALADHNPNHQHYYPEVVPPDTRPDQSMDYPPASVHDEADNSYASSCSRERRSTPNDPGQEYPAQIPVGDMNKTRKANPGENGQPGPTVEPQQYDPFLSEGAGGSRSYEAGGSNSVAAAWRGRFRARGGIGADIDDRGFAGRTKLDSTKYTVMMEWDRDLNGGRGGIKTLAAKKTLKSVITWEVQNILRALFGLDTKGSVPIPIIEISAELVLQGGAEHRYRHQWVWEFESWAFSDGNSFYKRFLGATDDVPNGVTPGSAGDTSVANVKLLAENSIRDLLAPPSNLSEARAVQAFLASRQLRDADVQTRLDQLATSVGVTWAAVNAGIDASVFIVNLPGMFVCRHSDTANWVKGTWGWNRTISFNMCFKDMGATLTNTTNAARQAEDPKLPEVKTECDIDAQHNGTLAWARGAFAASNPGDTLKSFSRPWLPVKPPQKHYTENCFMLDEYWQGVCGCPRTAPAAP